MSQKSRYAASAKTKSKVAEANKHINFVVVVYVVILIYIVTVIYLSLTKEHFSSFYAEYGQILNESTFKGIILRKETVLSSNEDGPVKYFIPEGTKARQGAYVCATNQDPELEQVIEDQINKHLSQLNSAMSLTLEDHTVLQSKIRDYVIEKSSETLDYTYNAKSNIKNTLMDLSSSVYIKDQALYEQVQQSIATNEAERLSNGTYYKMPVAGVVGYTIDGFEKYYVDNMDYSIIAQNPSINDVSENESTKKGDPLFKVIDNRLIYITTEIDAYCAKYLEDKNYISLYFPKKNLDFVVKKYSVETIDGKIYATFEVDRYIDDFLIDRFIDFKIVYENYSGIKVPNESVTTKSVYQVPKSAIFEEKGLYKIQKQVYDNGDTTHKQIVPVVIKVYMMDSEYAYIDVMNDESQLNIGDEVLYTESSTDRVSQSLVYTVDKSVALDGVFVINKGYTDFRRIRIIHEGDSFSIIESDLSYSVGLYDRVVTDAKGVKEFTTIN